MILAVSGLATAIGFAISFSFWAVWALLLGVQILRGDAKPRLVAQAA